MKPLPIAITAIALAGCLTAPAQAANQVIELSCYERVTYGYYMYNGTHLPTDGVPRSVRYTIDLARERWKSSDTAGYRVPWTPFARTTNTEIYLESNPIRQIILRRGDLQLVNVEWQERGDVTLKHGVVVIEGRCKRLSASRQR